MPFNGNGTFVRLHNWTSDAANSIDINAGEMDGEDDGFASGLSNCVTRDGQGKMGADFTPGTPSAYNLGTSALPWLTLNGQPIAGLVTYPTTALESATGITPVSYQYPPGHVFRYETGAQIVDWLSGAYAYDHGPLIQAAVATKQSVFLPAGNPLLKTGITVTTPGQRISGAGPRMTLLSVQSTFNLGAQGVFILAQSAQPGAELQDFGIYFVQPDTATYSSLIQYPPGIYAVSQPRFNLRRLRIANAITCINMSGNSGGSYLEDLELSHYTLGINLGLAATLGCLDTVRIINCHFWPFGAIGAAEMTANQQTLYALNSNVGLAATNTNELIMSGNVWLCGQACTFSENAVAAMWANIVACAFDTGSGIAMSGGEIFCGNCYFGPAAGNAAIDQQGGVLVISGASEIELGSTTSVSINHNNTSGVQARMVITDTYFNGFPATNTFSAILLENSGSELSDIIIADNHFFLPQNTSPADPIINLSGTACRLLLADNLLYDKGSGTGVFLAVNTDGCATIRGNNFFGWGLDIPPSAAATPFLNNLNVVNSAGATLLASNKGTGTFPASTSVVVTHGVNWNGIAPSVDQISITPTSAPPSGGVWVSAVSATTFTLSAATSTSMTFGWQVQNPNVT